ncbi:MAG: glucose-1-phosphate adenylyltransferase [Planctomycetota bacterium]|nr:MAG: glucose-1-phosphate adenylyltransferase [Planctomycetota bacterium]REJ87070.1 MAG: glucose-1-phosphate adenylyltransferase [Planctomycetota bacterium]REK27012.1 MAG: glucose-1-phosphate adenylyltransferase [Planctomycetota bacterium]REK47261.1 MAG: glucose-1-phosphate adenylyltransferase [Planctomycetota bacterium]
MRKVMALVLGGGRGTRLHPLTRFRSKPAVPLAGKYRLIDVPISNCLNSGLRRIYVLTQFNSVSLHRHIRNTYTFDRFSGGYVEILAAQQTNEDNQWYQGTADAVRKNIRYFDQPDVENVLILSGDQLYRMDFQQMLDTHRQSGAEATIAAIPVSREDASSLGIMQLDETGRVCGFVEKPQTDTEIESVRMDPAWIDARGIKSDGRELLASMGIYLFNRKFLVDVLQRNSYQDFGKEVFPASFRASHVQTHLFDGYWEDVGTIGSFYDCNLALASPRSPFQFVTPEAPIYSRARHLPPTRCDGGTLKGSLVADGCIIGEGTTIENSVVGLRCQIGDGVTIRNSIVMGADYYESPEDLANDSSKGRPPLGIGSGTYIEGAIIDKNCHIGSKVRIVNDRDFAEQDISEDVVVRDQIVVVQRGSTLLDGWKL